MCLPGPPSAKCPWKQQLITKGHECVTARAMGHSNPPECLSQTHDGKEELHQTDKAVTRELQRYFSNKGVSLIHSVKAQKFVQGAGGGGVRSIDHGWAPQGIAWWYPQPCLDEVQQPPLWGWWDGRTDPQGACGAAWGTCPCWCLSRVPAVGGVDAQLEHPHLHRVCTLGTHTFQCLQNPHHLWGAGCAHPVCVCVD